MGILKTIFKSLTQPTCLILISIIVYILYTKQIEFFGGKTWTGCKLVQPKSGTKSKSNRKPKSHRKSKPKPKPKPKQTNYVKAAASKNLLKQTTSMLKGKPTSRKSSWFR